MQDQIFKPKIIENNSNVNFSIAKSAQEIVQFQERQESMNQLGAVHILRNTKWGGGSSRFITNSEKMSQIYVFRWVRPDYYDIT